MARVKNPLGSEQARGAKGQTVFMGWRGIQTARARVAPTNPRTSAQLNARAKLTALSREWGKLSKANATLWNAYAKNLTLTDSLGQNYNPSGINAFVRVNNLLWLVYGTATPNSTPPATAPTAHVSSISQQTSGGNGELAVGFSFSGTPATLSRVQVMLTAGSNSPNRNPAASEYRFKTYELAAAGVVTISGLTPDAWYGIAIRYIDPAGQPTGYVTGYFKAESK